MSAAALVFDPEQHVYTLGGREIPGCTRCLDVAGISDFSTIRADILERKSELGRTVHQACHYYDDGGVDWNSIPAAAVPYVEAWIQFLAQQSFEIDRARIEQPISANINGMSYGMQPDRVGLMRGRPAIVDIKTTATVYDHHAIQLAGYAAGLPHDREIYELGPAARFIKWERYVVQLRNNGTFRLHTFKDTTDLHVFSWALGITHWKLAHGTKIRSINLDD